MFAEQKNQDSKGHFSPIREQIYSHSQKKKERNQYRASLLQPGIDTGGAGD